MALRTLVVACAVSVGAASAGLLAPAASAGGADGEAVALASDVPAALASAQPVGALNGSRRLSLQIDMRLRHFTELEAAIAELTEPRSPGYQRFATPAQLTARYGPTVAQLGVVESYLRSAGVTITSVSPQRTMVDATASASVAERAFGVRIVRWRGADGSVFYSPATDPVLPAAVGRLVLAVSGLDDLATLQPQTVTCTTKPTGGAPAGTCAEPGGASNRGYSPAQLRSAYGLARLASSHECGKVACDGHGQYIGIVAFGSSWDPDNEAAFDKKYGLNVPSPSSTAFCPRNMSCPIPTVHSSFADVGAVTEADLDVEMAHAIAPGARVLIYQTAKPVFSGLGDVLSLMLNKKAIATTNSISYGTCELDVGSSQAEAMHQEFALLADRGQVFFAATGDSGKTCFTHTGGPRTGPSYPASDSLVTAVGGTNLFLNTDDSYAYEYAWSESGGGSSLYPWNTRPSWQKGTGLPKGNRRLVPDVSAEALCTAPDCPRTSRFDYSITGPGTKYPDAQMGVSERTWCWNGSSASRCWRSTDGTSVASPIWAATAAVINQHAQWSGQVPLNANVSAELYALAFKRQSKPGAITDVTYQAENGADLYQNAAKGWDGATGVGSPQALAIAADLPGITGDATVSGVDALSGTDVWVAGTICVACSATVLDQRNLLLHWNGQGWTRYTKPSPGVLDNLSQVSASSARFAFAVGTFVGSGTEGQILRWDGTKWSTSQIVNLRSNDTELGAVVTRTKSDAWAVGEYCAAKCSADPPVDHTLILHWNGSTWTRTPSPTPSTSFITLDGVTATAPDNAWAVGSYCANDCGPNGTQPFDSLILHWNGSTWTQVPSPNPNPGCFQQYNSLTAVTATSRGNAWAVGKTDLASNCGGGLLVVHWNGTAWTEVHTGSTVQGDLNGVTEAPGGTVWASGDYYDQNSGDFRPLILARNGTTWSQATIPGLARSAAFLQGISADSASDAWSVGYYCPAGCNGERSVLRVVVVHWNGTQWIRFG